MKISDYRAGKDPKLTREEIVAGIDAIFNRKQENKTIEIRSDEMVFSEVFNVARELSRCAEEKQLGITFIAINPKDID